jgi:hypothetical protein
MREDLGRHGTPRQPNSPNRAARCRRCGPDRRPIASLPMKLPATEREPPLAFGNFAVADSTGLAPGSGNSRTKLRAVIYATHHLRAGCVQ